MKNTLKSIISIILVLSIMLSTAVTASARFSIEDEYISDLRLIYADTYEEAKRFLSDSRLEGYKVLDRNLNEYSGEVGVWLAYEVTNDINEAITDVAIMQMGGGYSAANYQAMIEEIRNEYLEMGDTYIQAIDYFTEAYDSGDFLAEAAYRQLNFYAGFDKYPEDGLGDLFTYGILRPHDVANIFFEGNSGATENIRTLLAMGVSYNEDGMHYLERVDKLVAGMGDGTGLNAFSDSDVDIYVYSNNELKTLSQFIAPNIIVFRGMFEELSAYENELNYMDEDITDLEIQYAEYKAIAEMMRSVDYIDGKSLYDFCLDYVLDTSDYTSLYPLAAALNEGQIAMTQLANYYDIVRYSVAEYPEESMDEEIAKLEARYINNPFDIYTGVDRGLLEETFALTQNAYRENVYDSSNALGESLFGGMDISRASVQLNIGRIDARFSVWTVVRSGNGGSVEAANGLSKKVIEKLDEKTLNALKELENTPFDGSVTYGGYVEQMYLKVEQELGEDMLDDVVFAWNSSNSLIDKAFAMYSAVYAYKLPTAGVFSMGYMQSVGLALLGIVTTSMKTGQDEAAAETISMFGKLYESGMYFWGVYSSINSAILLYKDIYNHYHPKYDEIPMVMVDIVKTEKGDRYVRYDVVCEVMTKNGEYPAADLNAFAGERWNAVYYTKNPEAGKPLLADFEVSSNNNRADEGYHPVHRFGEVICYDLNKYNFSSDSATVFLSIRQSEKQKYIVADAPDVVGAVFGTGFWITSIGIGITLGVCVTITLIYFLKKKRLEESNLEKTDD